MLRIIIPEPCHEKWDQMTPVEKGVFCQSCKKTVTDFSGMNDKEILDHLATQQFQPSCGRFRSEQMDRPLIYISPDVMTMDIPLWKKFIAALFICFSGLLTSCSNEATDKIDVTSAIISPLPNAVSQQQMLPEEPAIDPVKESRNGMVLGTYRPMAVPQEPCSDMFKRDSKKNSFIN